MKKYLLKICKKHGEVEHRKENTRKNYRCVKCGSEAVQRRREKVKYLSVEYKGGRCEKCGYNKSIAALEFHHLDPKQKDFGISYKGYTRSWETVKKELDKCILLCSNCHREEHENSSI